MKTKHYLFLILIALMVSKPAVAQNEYFENNPFWLIKSYCTYHPPCVENRDYNYYINGDTTINTKVYKKITEEGIYYNQWFSMPPVGGPCEDLSVHPYSATPFFLRSENKKFFVKLAGDPTEHLLYDFDLAVGDTLPVTYNNLDEDITVISIDSISTPLGYRKRFKLSQPDNSGMTAEYLIEGAGSNRGLIEPMYSLLECAYELDCYGLDNASYYPQTGPACYLSIEKQEQDLDFRIAPNPFSVSTTIQFNTKIENGDLEIYNLYGQKMRSLAIKNSHSITIDRGDLIEGIYFLSLIKNGNAVSLGKIVVSD